METSNEIEITGAYERIFSLASDIARWPTILPHYRWVKILENKGAALVVVAEMAARHKGIPLWWKTLQRPRQAERKIYFTHIGGITKGMEVEWRFEKLGSGGAGPGTWRVTIHHNFSPPWPWPGPWLAEHVVGGIFVRQVANKTLKRIKELVESRRTYS
jgi:ribosome-associated toxin RatA of RatAB toxin-antitoxin module